uniref:hypothetical protein n=1 Tax=Bacillus altitudinis TaxID=293387 RepID=UPI001C92FB76
RDWDMESERVDIKGMGLLWVEMEMEVWDECRRGEWMGGGMRGLLEERMWMKGRIWGRFEVWMVR